MKFRDFLEAHKSEFDWPFKSPYTLENGCQIQLLPVNGDLGDLMHFIRSEIEDSNKIFAYGGYREDRDIYRNATLFGSKDPRTIHLGLDIWCGSGTPVYMPLSGHIHSFRDNQNEKDYGPTIITKHTMGHQSFFMLFGHLSRGSITGIGKGAVVNKGDTLAKLGNSEENGHWPPHLHFQIIKDIGNHEGDYPGVTSKSDLDQFLLNCPDPMIIFSK